MKLARRAEAVPIEIDQYLLGRCRCQSAATSVKFGLVVIARRIENLADEQVGFVVEIGFGAYELQNCRHVRPRLVRVQHVSLSRCIHLLTLKI
jgi:hypothetical protein